MTTTVRSVRVELEMGIASYIANATTAGRVTENMADRIKKSAIQANIGVRDLQSSTQRLGEATTEAKVQQTQLAPAIDRTGTSAGRAERSIDKYSGRLRVLTDLALTGGPALLRLGTGLLPAVSAGLAGIGAAAGGIGVTVLAVSGLGDALKALNDYELERTPENLQKARVELERLGPSGAHFVRYLDDLEPVLHGLQETARDGIFPGFEEGIDDSLKRLPIVRDIIESLANEIGDLGAETGDAIASDRLTPFLEYIRETGAPTLDAFARSTGNVALGLANILVAFDPATQDALEGMVDGTERFARATEHLDDNERFQAFLSEVREAGPEALAFLGSAADLMIGLGHAAGPFGKVALPALTGVANAFAAIAKSPVGPVLYTAAAGLILFNRAASVGVKAYDSLSTGLDRLGTKATTTKDKLALLTARGGVVLTGAVAVGALADSINRIDTDNLDRSLTALSSTGDVTGTIDKVIDSLDELTATRNKVDLGEIATAGGLFGDSSMDKFANNVDQVDQALARLVESGQQAQAADLFAKISELAEGRGVSPEETAARFDAYAVALDNAAASASHAAGVNELLGGSLERTAAQEQAAADGAQAFSDALAGLNGWLDKREALRSYRDGLKEIGKGLKDGFGREDVDNIDAVGRSISQVASTIKDRALRADFLAGAKASLQEVADNAGPKAKAEIEKLIGALDRYGLTKPPAPKLDADDKPARAKVTNLKGYFRDLVGQPYEAKLTADAGQALSATARVMAALLGIDGRVATSTINVRTVHTTVNGGTVKAAGGALTSGQSADGGTVPKTGMPYADRHPYLLADGEEVISNRNGQADRHRSLLKAINAGRLAGGGTAGDRVDTYTRRNNPGGGAYFQVGDAADHATRGLKSLEKAADKVRASYEKQKSKLDDLISQRDSAASSIASSYLHDPFGNGLAGFDAQLEADSGDLTAMTAALATLVKNGLDPKSALYQRLAASADVTTAQQLAQLSAGELAARAQQFQNVASQASAFGGGIAGQQFNEAIRESTKETRELRQELKHLRGAIHDLKDGTPKAKDIHDAVFSGSRDGAHEGTKAGQEGKDRVTAGWKRTGGPW